MKVYRDIIIIISVVFLLVALIVEAKEGVEPRIISPIPYYEILESKDPELAALTPDQENDWNAMKRMARKLAPLYGYPDKVIIAQMALESARGTSHFCRTRNNCLGVGAYDSNPDNAFSYDNKEQAILEYMRLIQNRYKKAYALRSNPDAMIVAIKEGGYATDVNYVAKIKAMPEWNNL